MSTQGKFFVKNHEIVIPGDLLATGKLIANQGVYKVVEKGVFKFYSKRVGLVSIQGNKISVVPLEGGYIPAEGDIVIGKISDVGLTHWIVDINSPYSAILNVNNVIDRPIDPLKDDLTRILNVGDLILAKVSAFDRTRDPVLTLQGRGLHKIHSGRLVEVDPVRIPRIIGKKGSMLKLLKDKTNSKIYIGQNGRIVVRNDNPVLLDITLAAIDKIVKEAHISGLTDRVKAFIDEQIKKLQKNRKG